MFRTDGQNAREPAALTRVSLSMVPLRLALCCLLAVMVGCGEGPGEQTELLSAEAVARDNPEEGPGLVGRARPGDAQAAGGGEPSGPQATVDEHAEIHIPDGASWSTVTRALDRSAQRRREREQLMGPGAMLVSLPGLDGYVIVGGQPPVGAPGLSLELRAQPRATAIEAVGNAWVAEGGCDATLSFSVDGWSLPLWRERVAALEALPGVGEHGIQVRAESHVPAATVQAFLEVVASTSLGAPHVVTSGRRRFEDPTHGALMWLHTHRVPEAGFDAELAPAFCDGLRMQSVPLAYDPRQAEDAGLTGLSLLAFLGAGYTNRGKHIFRPTVSRGLRYLKTRQLPTGRFQGDRAWDDGVTHAFAALALVEAYGMTGSPIFKGSAQRGLDALKVTWRASREETLCTALTAMAWRSGQIINEDYSKRGKPEPLILDEKLPASLLEAAARFQDGSGNLDLACGLVTRIMLDRTAWKDPLVKAGAMKLAKAVEASGTKTPPVVFYLATLACYRVGYSPWKKFNKLIERFVADTQQRDGHVCCERGSWPGAARGIVPGGRVAATALHSLCLEVFYRYDKVFGVR